MNWTKLEREGYKPHTSLFDDGFPHVPTDHFNKWDWVEAIASIVLLALSMAILAVTLSV